MFELIPEVIFGNKRSYNDWGIYWNGDSIDVPAPQKSTVKVPFRNGILDFTPRLTGNKIFYDERKISFDFLVDGDNILSWDELYSMIMRDVHGKSLHIIKTTDPDFYWDAYECTVSGPPSENEGIMSIKIEATCFPYKLRVKETTRTVSVTSSNVILKCPCGRMEVNPTFNTNQDVTVRFTDYSGTVHNITMSAGTHTYSNIEFRQGINQLRFIKVSENATVNVSYREGEL